VAAILYRLGQTAFRRRWYVVFIWVALLAGVGVAATRAPAAPPDSPAIPGTESQAANDLLQSAFHTNPGGATAQVIFVAPHGQKVTAQHDQTVIDNVVAEAARSPQVAGAVNPFTAHEVSRDGSAAIATITYKVLTLAVVRFVYLSATRVLILTTFEIDEYVARALRAGASGFLGKDISADELLAGIRTVTSGEALLSPQATRALISRFLAAPEPGAELAAPDQLSELTAREREVMSLAAEGYSNSKIAARLVLSPLTVRTHVQRAMMKLRARDRAQLVVIAYQTGLVTPTPQSR